MLRELHETKDGDAALSSLAAVTERGAVLLGRSVACDAFEESRPVRVVTHAHSDHIVGLSQSMRRCRKILMTKATRDFIGVIQGPLFLTNGSVETLEYEEPFCYDGERITFFGADHILGAAQVLVEDEKGTRFVYTGDFRIDKTPVIEADVLVIEATYGSPACKRSFGVDVKAQLVSLVRRGLESGVVYVFGYYGKLHEVMHTLHESGVDVPFVAPGKVFHFSKVYEAHGLNLGSPLLSSEAEALELLRRRSPCVVFHHMQSKNTVGLDAFRVNVSGWEFSCPVRQVAEKEYVVALSDHSDFDGLLEYVRLSKPKFVITDNFRVSHGEALAKEISRRLGVSAVALPRK